MRFRIFHFAVACVCIASVTCLLGQRVEPNAFEAAYEALAANSSGLQSILDVETPLAICSRISRDAVDDRTGFTGSPGRYFTRSECFMRAALNVGDMNLCAHVIAYTDRTPDPAGVSRDLCEQALRRNRSHQGGSYGAAGTALLLFAAGYRDDDISRVYREHPEEPRYYEFLTDHVFNTPAMEKLVRSLPDFSKGDETARAQVRESLPHCESATGDVACELVACGFVREQRVYERCFDSVAKKFGRVFH